MFGNRGQEPTRRDEKAPWALNYGSGEGGAVENVCAAHGERAAVGVDVEQGVKICSIPDSFLGSL